MKYSIFSQIFIPYTILIILIFGALFLYYPKKQKELLTEYKISEMNQQASSLAISVEASLERDDLLGLEKTTSRLQSISNLTAVSYVFVDDSNKVDFVNTIPQGVDHFKLLSDTLQYITVKTKFSATPFYGFVMITQSKDKLSSDINKINKPIFFFLSIVGILVILVIYWLAKLITGPINVVKEYAHVLKTGQYDLDNKMRMTRTKELTDLQESLLSLSKTLKSQDEENKKLTSGLEDEVQSRTHEIVKKNTYLEHAAKIIRHDMHSGINTYIPRGISSLEKRLDSEILEKYKLQTPLKMLKEGLKHTQDVYKGVYEFTNLVKKDAVLNKKLVDIKKMLEEFLSTTSYGEQVIIEELIELNVNESLFCTAIDNLIRNGLKYNDSNIKWVKIYMKNPVTIFVQDNGRGLDVEKFKNLSNPYKRKMIEDESNSGLGLNICIAILEEHGFSIKCKRAKEGGTIFLIKI